MCQLKRYSIRSIFEQFPDIPRTHLQAVICSAKGWSEAPLAFRMSEEVKEEEYEVIFRFVSELRGGKPLAYLLGVVEFYNLKLHVSNDVLIPRQETEILLDKIVTRLKGKKNSPFKVIDLCSGSGCLGLGVKKTFPSSEVTLIDICEKTLNVAKKNALVNGLEVVFCKSDLLEDYRGAKVDLLIANPPYISAQDYKTLDEGVRDHEPEIALVGGETGLEIFQRISCQISSVLNPGALVAFEMGYDQGSLLLELFRRQEGWKGAVVEKDWAGHDRFFFLEKE